MRKPIAAANWKMNKTIPEGIEFIKKLKPLVKGVADVEIVIFPSFVSIPELKKEALHSNILIGAQNAFYENKGTFTGEISPLMLKELCDYVIIGHSERRAYFNESNSFVNKKIKKVLENGLKPILCIGENSEEREKGKTYEVLEEQLKEGLKDLGREQLLKLDIAYEPVWAISKGPEDKTTRNATPGEAQEVHAFVRKFLSDEYGKNASEKTRLQYGGSVKPENALELMKLKDIDGALIGGASLEAESFCSIIKKISEAKK